MKLSLLILVSLKGLVWLVFWQKVLCFWISDSVILQTRERVNQLRRDLKS